MYSNESLTNTVCAESLKRFLENAERLPACFRCLFPLPLTAERAVFAQVLPFKKAKTQAVGGVLCAKCVDEWHAWRKSGIADD